MWHLIQYEAQQALGPEPEAGVQIYMSILSQPSLLHGLTQVICNEVATPSVPATSLRQLFLETLCTDEDLYTISRDVMAVTMRSTSVKNAMMAVIFHQGLHALVCHRLAHRLWTSHRRYALATFLQSTVSTVYSADVHPAARLGSGLYLNIGGGVVVGETAVVGDDCTILQGVTLGGTGKERGDRHPKLGRGVTLHPGSTVMGNIVVGDHAVVRAKSIVTKAVPSGMTVSGVPAKEEVVVVESDNENQPHSLVTSAASTNTHRANHAIANNNNNNNNSGSDLSHQDQRERLEKYQHLQCGPTAATVNQLIKKQTTPTEDNTAKTVDQLIKNIQESEDSGMSFI